MKPVRGVVNGWKFEPGKCLHPRLVGVLFQAPGIPMVEVETSSIVGMVETPFGRGVETRNSIYILGSYGGTDE